MAMVMIGVDPHKASYMAVTVNAAEEPLGQLRVRASAVQAERLLEWARAWPERTWAVEGAGGLGHLLAQQLPRSTRGDPEPPIWAATWIARVLVVTAPERLFGSRPGENKPRPACAWPAMPASPLPGAFTPPPRSPTANNHEVLNGFGRRPASCPAMLPAVTAG